MSMKQGEISQYLERAHALKIIPNFWLSQEYLSIQDAKLENNGKIIWIQEDDWAVFPPLPLHSHIVRSEDSPPLKIWSDFENFAIGDELEFLDWEYTYDANQFLEMKGGRWKVFRKNVRKWPRENEDWSYSDDPPPRREIEKLLVKWLSSKDEEIMDSESMLWFMFKGAMRGFLFRKDALVGVNIWDSNEPYLMFRYCVTDPDEPFLNEFARLLFYQSMPNRLVIDGGSLGNPGLERFKDKLNPVKKRGVYSRIIGNSNDK